MNHPSCPISALAKNAAEKPPANITRMKYTAQWRAKIAPSLSRAKKAERQKMSNLRIIMASEYELAVRNRKSRTDITETRTMTRKNALDMLRWGFLNSTYAPIARADAETTVDMDRKVGSIIAMTAYGQAL